MEGVKSSVQLPPKDAPLAPVGPFLSLMEANREQVRELEKM
jgi:hypothetical protein